MPFSLQTRILWMLKKAYYPFQSIFRKQTFVLSGSTPDHKAVSNLTQIYLFLVVLGICKQVLLAFRMHAASSYPWKESI
jgi:hypothetical protein